MGVVRRDVKGGDRDTSLVGGAPRRALAKLDVSICFLASLGDLGDL